METDDRPRPGNRVSLLMLTAGLVLVVGGLVGWYLQAREPATSTTGPLPTATPTDQDVVLSPALPRAERAEWKPGAPRRLEVPGLGIDAPVVPIEAPGGVLTPPSDPQVLGWWASGAKPGSRLGSALVTGHTVHSGGGAMDHLERLANGDRVWMRTDRGRIRYDVRSVVVLGKGELAQRATRLFSQDVPGRLVLITCEDWNGQEYLSNVVVTATPTA